jgi:lactam utilization protein B
LRVDLNADIGESFGIYQAGNDEMLMRSITSQHRVRLRRDRP